MALFPSCITMGKRQCLWVYVCRGNSAVVVGVCGHPRLPWPWTDWAELEESCLHLPLPGSCLSEEECVQFLPGTV